MWGDVKRRAPYYGSDILDAWDYRIIPATVYMYFAKYARLIISILPKNYCFKSSMRFTSYAARWQCSPMKQGPDALDDNRENETDGKA